MKKEPTLQERLIMRIEICSKVERLGLTKGTRQRAREQLTKLKRTLEAIRGTDEG